MIQKASELLTIGEVADAVGVAATTLRYYEREGILTPSSRTEKGYRLYDEEALHRLQFIRAAQAVGFTLDDIRALMMLSSDTSCKEVQSLIERRLHDVEQKLDDLRRVRTALSTALNRCRKSKRGCAVLTDLRTATRKGNRK